MKITEKEFNIQTGEETITERDETKAEETLREKLEAKQLEAEAEAEAKATAKADLLAKLGITSEEAALLLS
jgi:sulfur carrier protein ThiS